MKLEDFTRLKWFAPHEKGMEGFEHIELNLMLRVDAMRDYEGERDGWVFIVNETYRPFNPMAPFTYHGFKAGDEIRCKAIDGAMVDRATRRPLPLLRQWAIAERWIEGGIGLYPFWERDGRPFPGLHLDDREHRPFERHARWWRDAAGNYRDFYEFLELSGLWGSTDAGVRLDLAEQEAATLERFIARELPALETRFEVSHLEQTLEKLREARVGV
ncbi:MAG: hypothetical protein RX318_03865 [bacterium]|nr:hypothetical protein [bacterium]